MQRDERLVVLFGGTFDPPHVGHLAMAQLALEQTRASHVCLLPSPAPPHKEEQSLPFDVRVKLCQALVEGYDRLQVSTFEADLPRPSFTVDTVLALKTLHPNTRFLFLLGGDSLAQLPTWERAQELARTIPFLVAARSTYPLASTLDTVCKQLPGIQVQAVEMPILDVSSSWLRARFNQNLSLCGLVPEPVLVCWRAHSHARQ